MNVDIPLIKVTLRKLKEYLAQIQIPEKTKAVLNADIQRVCDEMREDSKQWLI